jgi:AraC-like DNA-binding protein
VGLLAIRNEQAVNSIDVEVLVKLFDQAPNIAFFVKDAEGRYTVVNESLVRRHGLKRKSDVLGKRPCDICVGDFGQLPSEQDAKLLRTGRPLIDHLEMQWQQPYTPVWCLTTKLPIFDSAGNIIGLVGFSRDVQVPVESSEIPHDFATALEQLEQNLNDDWTPATLAHRAGMPPQRLARLMKRLFGLSSSQFIIKSRIAAASRLLCETDQSISAIALACGYYDHSAFTRVFRAATGVTPSQYREQR